MSSKDRDLEWSALMRAALSGDDASYRSLLSALTRDLRPLVRRGVDGSGGGSGDIEDIVQEIVLAIHLKRHTWDAERPIVPWVYAIARNKMIDNLRRRGRRAEIDIEPFIEVLEAEPADAGTDRSDTERMLAGLPERQKAIVEAIAIEGRSAREVGMSLGMTEVAVRVTLHRSLKSLAKKFRQDTP